jgi:2,3-dimethylmalate lyase
MHAPTRPDRGLAALLDAGTVVAPTAYDMVAARVIEQVGFPAVFCSGYGQAASALGLPDGGLMTLDVLAQRVEAMARTVSLPVLVDADTGYDDPERTVRTLAAAGASAVMIEDQLPAKRCGHVPGKQVVPLQELVERIAAAASGRPPGVLLIARTDALEPHGLDDALARGRACVEAGADVVFVEAPESVEQLGRIARELPCPAMANVLPGGRTPELSVAELGELGFRLVVFGLVDLMLATAALRSGLTELARSGSLATVATPRLDFAELNALTGLTAHVAAGA